ncbi:hypothetical protein [Mycobacteroides franklinii]|uniref:Uncharacterized protein n=1 Tax=Mycobacteroides franklinii TaxID=948102 RepID=A0A4R5PDM4_9MYCO|nr:hypothetical protein [Mycobacteroides franklinii]ORA60914.1 hypothetical protein BST24_12115 [Mycobacteroides franklinii]TDH23150.1 hypothetical protein EJ571_06735 [Mycobacteroides franklinii]
MPSTDGLVHHDLTKVTEGNSQIATAFTGPSGVAAVRAGADPFTAVLATLDTQYDASSAPASLQLGAVTKMLHGKNDNSSGILMGADGENGAAMDTVTT